MELVRPAAQHLDSYLDALARGWSPDATRPATDEEDVGRITADPQSFLEGQDDRYAEGPPITLPDGSTVPRLPGFHRWMWDGDFCGVIGLRWQPGTAELPPTCLGHIGYSVVPWKRNRGYATAALRQLLPDARQLGFPYVELTTNPDNIASQRVIVANGGELVEEFIKPPVLGGGPALRYRIPMAIFRAETYVDSQTRAELRNLRRSRRL